MQSTTILSGRRIIKAAAVALVLAGLGTAGILSGAATPPAAHAADRPGTPIGIQVVSNAPEQLTLSWVPTASEETCSEFLTTQDGNPVDLHAGCVYTGSPRDRLNGWRQSYVFNGLSFNSSYCFQVRARDWNDGDPQSGYVSELWSGQVCATPMVPSFGSVTPSAPGKPAPPTLKTATINGWLQATLTWSGYLNEGDIVIKLADWYTVQYLDHGSWITPSPQMPALNAMLYVYTPPLSARSVTGSVAFRICAGNSTGVSCSDTVRTPSDSIVAVSQIDPAILAAIGTPAPPTGVQPNPYSALPVPH